jgi:hypothetical protein
MVEYIEEFAAKLKDQPLGEMRVFRNREIDIPESRAVHCVATQIAVFSSGRRERKRVDIAIRWTSAQNPRDAGHNVGTLTPIEPPTGNDTDRLP